MLEAFATSLPVTVGAVIVGPLLIGAGVLVLIGLGAMYLSGGRKQTRQLSSAPGSRAMGAAGGQGSEQPAAPDPRDTMPYGQLRQQAGSMLVAADEAVRSSDQEILFAQAAYGDEAVEVFRQDIQKSKDHLRDAFRLQQQLDQQPPQDETEARRIVRQIMEHCEQLDASLDAHRQEFEGLRDLERSPGPAAAQLNERLADLRTRLHAAAAELPQLQKRYTGEPLESLQQNLDRAEGLLEDAQSHGETAAQAAEAHRASDAVVAIHAGERSAAEAAALLDSADQTSSRLQDARRNLDVGVAQTEQDVAQARATRDAGQAPELAGPIAAAEAAVARVRQTIDSGERYDPLELLLGLELAHRELDEPLNAVRDRQAQDRRAREMLQTELLTARNQVQSSQDYLRSRAHRVGTTARTRLAEAERCLSEAQAFADTQPARALDFATQAKTLAVQAAQIAEQDRAEENLMNTGGGFGGYGRHWGGGYGTGYGGGYGTGYGYGGGYGRRRGSGRAGRRMLRYGMRHGRRRWF
ncbi:hypothetical protein Q7C18_00515 [Nesterenkonia sp. CL21]|uniref:hypothetical protein n=1 Tax=Nesterenkonia sp. CL21 TaxID=3064894 RepID=UPI00287A37F8|nr:hypothetical protein [Nesterenkonia sp. CL21]MDS2171179.1 hypothetical protein [Nesterenkonia sp. CL21]